MKVIYRNFTVASHEIKKGDLVMIEVYEDGLSRVQPAKKEDIDKMAVINYRMKFMDIFKKIFGIKNDEHSKKTGE